MVVVQSGDETRCCVAMTGDSEWGQTLGLVVREGHSEEWQLS